MKKRILVVDDDKFNCLIYETILRSIDFDLEFAADGQEAVDKYREKAYDLVVLDMGLPILKGYEVADIMRFIESTNRRLKAPIIAVSADGSDETQKKAFNAGVNQYLLKPINVHDFTGLIDRYLNKMKATTWYKTQKLQPEATI